VLQQPGFEGVFLANQTVAPELGLVQCQVVAGRAAVLFAQRCAQVFERCWINQAHEFADELHLAALALKIAYPLGLLNRIPEFF
jgi:hypothetical protein